MFKVKFYSWDLLEYTMKEKEFDSHEKAVRFAARRCAVFGNAFVTDRQGRVINMFAC